MKTILITGGTGFIGSHLCEYFSKKNFKVFCFDKKNKKNIHWLDKNKCHDKNIKILLNDIENKKYLEKIVRNVSCIIHLAAEISIPYSYVNPNQFVKTNVLGTINILDLAKKYNKEVIITSTSETYGSGKYFPMDESHRIFSQSPYAATKNAADQLSISYFNSFSTKVKIIRPFNCFGPRQSMRAIIPSLIVQMLKNERIIKIGNVNTERDFTYVEDLCLAYWKLYNSNKGFGEIINVCSSNSIKIITLYEKIKNITNYQGHIRVEVKRIRPKLSEVTKLLGSNKKIKRLLKWKPSNFDKNLNKTINWFQNNLEKYNNSDYEI
jgi:nucleoside-diphosphate-sugar epimerase